MKSSNTLIFQMQPTKSILKKVEEHILCNYVTSSTHGSEEKTSSLKSKEIVLHWSLSCTRCFSSGPRSLSFGRHPKIFDGSVVASLKMLAKPLLDDHFATLIYLVEKVSRKKSGVRYQYQPCHVLFITHSKQ